MTDPNPNRARHVPTPPSEFDPEPRRSKTPYQEFRSYAAEHKDDGWAAPVSSDGPPPSYGGS